MTIPDSQYLKASSVVQIYKPLYVLIIMVQINLSVCLSEDKKAYDPLRA